MYTLDQKCVVCVIILVPLSIFLIWLVMRGIGHVLWTLEAYSTFKKQARNYILLQLEERDFYGIEL